MWQVSIYTGMLKSTCESAAWKLLLFYVSWGIKGRNQQKIPSTNLCWKFGLMMYVLLVVVSSTAVSVIFKTC